MHAPDGTYPREHAASSRSDASRRVIEGILERAQRFVIDGDAHVEPRSVDDASPLRGREAEDRYQAVIECAA
jgi:hypothetical protein